MPWIVDKYLNQNDRIEELRKTDTNKRHMNYDFNYDTDDYSEIHDPEEASVIVYDINHNIIKTLYYEENGVLFMEMNYVNGVLHNDYGPAVILYDIEGMLFKLGYYKNGKLHNVHRPAEIIWRRYSSDKIRSVSYNINGIQHNTNGPAFIEWNSGNVVEYISYWRNNGRYCMIEL